MIACYYVIITSLFITITHHYNQNGGCVTTYYYASYWKREEDSDSEVGRGRGQVARAGGMSEDSVTRNSRHVAAARPAAAARARRPVGSGPATVT